MFHFTGLLGGPTIYYTEYEDVMSKPAKRERYPAVLRTLLTGMVRLHCSERHVNGIRSMTSWTLPFARRVFFSRLIVLYVFMLGMRCKYYGSLEAGRKHVFD